MAEPERAPCPFCGELIVVDAKKCRFCGEWLLAEQQDPPESETFTSYAGPGASAGRSGRLFKKEPWALRPDERVLARSQPYVRRYLIFWLVLAIPTLGVTALIAALIWIYFRLMRFEWILTDRRVITVGGWLTRSAHNVSLDKINEINYHRTFWQRVLWATGTIALETAATAGVTSLPHAADADPFRNDLEEQVEQRRRATVPSVS